MLGGVVVTTLGSYLCDCGFESLSWPQVGKLVVVCWCPAVYSAESWRTSMHWFLPAGRKLPRCDMTYKMCCECNVNPQSMKTSLLVTHSDNIWNFYICSTLYGFSQVCLVQTTCYRTPFRHWGPFRIGPPKYGCHFEHPTFIKCLLLELFLSKNL